MIVKQTVANGEEIKPSLDDLRVRVSHHGPWLLTAMFFLTEHQARRRFNNRAESLPLDGSGWRLDVGKG